jgi:hypothetical protein
VRDVPDMTPQKVAVRSPHRFFLEAACQPQNWPSKLLNDAFYAIFFREIKQLAWSDLGTRANE